MNIDSKGRAFPLLTQEALAAMELLGTPIFVYDFGTGHIIWSNATALQFWNAESGQELGQRELGPYSDSTRMRLADHLASFRNGEVVTESWTFYPKGAAVPTISRCRGISLEGSSEAMLVEIQVLSRAELPLPELWAIEALRHSSLMISMFSEAGEVLMRNPAAQTQFGALDRANSSGADLFRTMFADPGACQLLIDDARATGLVAARTAQMAIEGLPIHALQLSLITDPANG